MEMITCHAISHAFADFQKRNEGSPDPIVKSKGVALPQIGLFPINLHAQYRIDLPLGVLIHTGQVVLDG